MTPNLPPVTVGDAVAAYRTAHAEAVACLATAKKALRTTGGDGVKLTISPQGVVTATVTDIATADLNTVAELASSVHWDDIEARKERGGWRVVEHDTRYIGRVTASRPATPHDLRAVLVHERDFRATVAAARRPGTGAAARKLSKGQQHLLDHVEHLLTSGQIPELPTTISWAKTGERIDRRTFEALFHAGLIEPDQTASQPPYMRWRRTTRPQQ